MIGALLAAGLAGKFRSEWRVPLPHLVASALGGRLLGYGARLAWGCNIGAFFSGVASGSLHGWLWIAAALAGNQAGIVLSPRFSLPVERRQTACPACCIRTTPGQIRRILVKIALPLVARAASFVRIDFRQITSRARFRKGKQI